MRARHRGSEVSDATGRPTGSSLPTPPKSPIIETCTPGSRRSAGARRRRTRIRSSSIPVRRSTRSFHRRTAAKHRDGSHTHRMKPGDSRSYVRDFPGGGHKWQVSSQGGVQPHWRRDGRELVYLSLDGMLMSVAVDLAGIMPSVPRSNSDLLNRCLRRAFGS